MKYAILSDVHANLEALDSVLERAGQLEVDEIACLGDLVGYGANPNECVARLREREARCIAGNHDLAAVGLKDADGFWEVARKAIVWTSRELLDEHREFLRTLPREHCVPGCFLMVHGAVHAAPSPEDVYLETEEEIRKSLDALARHESGVRLGFFGHTHLHAAFRLREGRLESIPASRFRLDERDTYLINPGSVGVPREGPATVARFVVYDAELRSVEFVTVRYDAAAARRKARRHGLLREAPIRRLVKKAGERLRGMLRGRGE